MVIAEEETPSAKESHDIDLKCAEKVTDSDNEENPESCDGKLKKDTSNDGQQLDGNGARDFTCKPKPIKAQRQTIESPLLNYQQVPMYLNAYSPKNPSGILPFQPTGKLLSRSLCHPQSQCEMNKILHTFQSGGAFKTMPISPKDTKPVITASGAIATEGESQGEIKPSPPTVFTFTNAPLENSEWFIQENDKSEINNSLYSLYL